VGIPSIVASTSATFGKYDDDAIKLSASIYRNMFKVKAYNGDRRSKNVQVDLGLGSGGEDICQDWARSYATS
jgi:hypothetical protein